MTIYLTSVLMLVMATGKQVFGLPFDRNTPFYVSEVFLDTENARDLNYTEIGQPTNKVCLFTIVFQTFCLTIITNYIVIKFSEPGKYSYHSTLSESGRIRQRTDFMVSLCVVFILQGLVLTFSAETMRLSRLTVWQHLFCLLAALGSVLFVFLTSRKCKFK